MSHGGPGHVVSLCPGVLALWICSQPYWHLWSLNPAWSRHRCGWGLCEEALALESSLNHLLTQVRLSSWGILTQILTSLLVLTVYPCFLQGVHIHPLLQQLLDQSLTFNYVLMYIFIWSRFIWNTKSVILLFQNTLHNIRLCHPLKLNMQLNIILSTSLKDGHITQSRYLLSDSSLLCPKVE